MLIEVTQRHIDRGVQADCSLCPVAIALREAGFAYDQVRGEAVYFVNETPTIELPRSARRFIARFDNGRKVKPFRFIFKANITKVESNVTTQ